MESIRFGALMMAFVFMVAAIAVTVIDVAFGIHSVTMVVNEQSEVLINMHYIEGMTSLLCVLSLGAYAGLKE